jgi:transcriptional regulator with XRE-family HTH domain
MDKETVGANIRRLAGAHLIRQEELADFVKRPDGKPISRQGMNNLFLGTSMPSPLTARSIANAFGISMDDLFSDAGTCLRAAASAFEDSPVQRAMPRILEWRKRREELAKKMNKGVAEQAKEAGRTIEAQKAINYRQLREAMQRDLADEKSQPKKSRRVSG